MSEKVIRYGKLVIDRFTVWKMAAMRCLLKASLAAAGAFLAMDLSTSKFAEMGSMEVTKMLIGIAVVFFSNVDAFLDKTITNVSHRLGMEAPGNTEIISK